MIKRNVFVSLFVCLALASRASAQDLSAMFQEALGLIQPMQSLGPSFTIVGASSDAQKRVRDISNLFPSISSALLKATANPTEDARVEVCQLTARVNDMFLGADTLAGFDTFQGAFDSLRNSLLGSRRALNCTSHIPSFCPSPLKRVLLSTYSFNEGKVDATLSLEPNGTGTGTGSYRQSDGSVGQISNIQCFDSGQTMKARWSKDGSSGFLTFYYLDRNAKTFVGVYSDLSLGRERFQGTWDGKLSESQVPTGNGSVIVPNGLYTLRARHSGKCLDVRDRKVENSSMLQQWQCSGESNQTFRVERANQNYFTLKGLASGRCVSVQGVGYDNGVPMVLWDCHNGPDQLVQFFPSADGSYSVRFSHSDKCMDVQFYDSENGRDVHQWECTRNADQDWKLVPANPTPNPPPQSALVRTDLRYSLMSRNSGRCLDAIGGGTENGTKFQQYECFQNGAQSFHFREKGGGWYSIVNDPSGRCVSLQSASVENGTPLILWDCHQGQDQRVRLEPSVGGTVKVIFQHSNRCMDLAGSSMSNGAIIQQWDCWNSPNQDWILRPF
jgi:hypothetical protein